MTERGSVTIFTSGNRAAIKDVPKASARTFAEGVRARLAAKAAPPPPAAVAATASPFEQIEQLAGLKERGLLTEEEFTAKKRMLLGI